MPAGIEGASVACADKVLASAQETAHLVQQTGATAVAIEADVTTEASVADMVGAASAALGGLDGVVINVGIGNGKSLADQTEANWDAVMNVNLRGHMLVAKHAMAQLEPGGSIVFISSVASRSPMSRQPEYEASKTALSALFQLSHDASYVNALDLVVDGGLTFGIVL